MKKFITTSMMILILRVAYNQVNYGVIAMYTFNNSDTLDVSSNNHLWAPNGISYGEDRFGNAGKAALLDGVNDYLYTYFAFWVPSNGSSLSMWFKSNNASQANQTLFNTNPHNMVSVGFNWYGDGTFDIGQSTGSGWDICSTAPNGLDTFSISGVDVTEWNHLVWTYDGTDYKTYVNNEVVNTCNGSAIAAPIANLYLGSISVGPQSFFNGLLDDVRVYNRALSEAEVDTLYNEPNPVSTAGFGENESALTPISIYPNPVQDFLIISEAADIEITTVAGAVIARSDNTNYLTVQSYPAGVYFITLSRNGKVIQRNKIIKN